MGNSSNRCRQDPGRSLRGQDRNIPPHQGTVKKNMQLVGDGKQPLKVAHLCQLQGKDAVEVDALQPGATSAVAKTDKIEFGRYATLPPNVQLQMAGNLPL